MEVDNSYYKKIIYKKNAFDDLKTYIKLNYSNKKILLISTKSIPAENVTEILNALFMGSENVNHFISKNGFNETELSTIKKTISSDAYSLLISFGGGRCCDVTKYFAGLFGIPYVVCPSQATSLAYFSNYCINPFDASKSFYAEMPVKIFIQEGIIKNSNCYTNINGLAFLNSLRAVYVEGVLNDVEKERYVFLGLEKLFKKLEDEQTNILVCNEDSNLVLMDLFIDFGFFISALNKDEYYLINMINNYHKLSMSEFCWIGKKMLLCAMSILSLMKHYLELNSFKIFEKPDYDKISKNIKNGQIFQKRLKNNAYFSSFLQKSYLKKELIGRRDVIYKIICIEILKINEFCKKVKSVYKFGIEIEDNFNTLAAALSITPFLSGNNCLVDYIAGSGILNCFLNLA